MIVRGLCQEFPVELLCRVVALAHSKYYYQPCQPDELEREFIASFSRVGCLYASDPRI
jgi:hypothetical protein